MFGATQYIFARLFDGSSTLYMHHKFSHGLYISFSTFEGFLLDVLQVVLIAYNSGLVTTKPLGLSITINQFLKL